MLRFYAKGFEHVIRKLEPLEKCEIRKVSLVVRPFEQNLQRRIVVLTRLCELVNRFSPTTNSLGHAAVLVQCDEFHVRIEWHFDGLHATCSPRSEASEAVAACAEAEAEAEAAKLDGDVPPEIDALVAYRFG
jgi:hypothetical protein